MSGAALTGAPGPTDAGVLVVDVSDPAKPEVVHSIGQPHQDNEGETSREMRIWPEQNLLIVMNLGSNCSELIHACSPRSVEDNFRFYDISGKNAAKPKFVSEYKPSVNPHEFFLWEDPKNEGRALMFMSTPGAPRSCWSPTSRELARTSSLSSASRASSSASRATTTGCTLSVTPDGRTATIGYLEAGFYVADTTDFVRGKEPAGEVDHRPQDGTTVDDELGPGAHSAVPLFGSDFALVTDEVYGEALRAIDSGGCPWGWTRMIDTSDAKKPKVVAEFKLLQNDPDFCKTDVPRPSSSYASHNPTLTENLAFITWHAAGLQVLDISTPGKPAQAAEFKPAPLPFVLTEDPALTAGQDKVAMWSFPVIQDGLIYVVDVRNGLYILDYEGPFEKEVSKVKFLEGNSNRGDALKLGRL